MSATEQTAKTTMAALKPQSTENMPAVSMGFATLQSFELMQRAAKLLQASSLVPQNYRNNISDCVIALNMANRIGADPLMVMQNLYVVHGKPSWSAQFVIACFNQCGRFSAMRYRWFNKPAKAGDIPDDWGCQAYATELATGEEITGPLITITTAKKEGWFQKSGSKWQTIPELMLMYRAGSWLQRTHAPDISMGLRTVEEEHDIYDARRGADGTFEVTLDDIRPGASASAETVDADTGEVVTQQNGGAQQSEPAELKWTEQTAIEALQSKRKTDTLEAAWKEIVADYTAAGQRVPDAVDAKHTEMHESLLEREALQGDGEPAQGQL